MTIAASIEVATATAPSWALAKLTAALGDAFAGTETLTLVGTASNGPAINETYSPAAGETIQDALKALAEQVEVASGDGIRAKSHIQTEQQAGHHWCPQ